MSVLVVMCGEYGEGGSVCGVFEYSGVFNANRCALSQRSGGRPEWKKVENSEYPWGEWESGCDWVRIEEHKVLP